MKVGGIPDGLVNDLTLERLALIIGSDAPLSGLAEEPGRAGRGLALGPP